MPNPVVYFEIAGRSANGLQQFYTELFNWKVEKFMPSDEYWHVQKEDEGISGGIMEGIKDIGSNYVTIYIQVDDIQTYLDKAESLGGRTLVPPTPLPGGMGQVGMFVDPDGNTIGLHKF